MKQKIITVLSEGDSNQPSTWSNVPYFLTKTLEQKGFIVRRENVGGYKLLSFVYNKIIIKFIKLFYHKDCQYCFNRTKLFKRLVEYKMKRIVRKNSDTDIYFDKFQLYPLEIYKVVKGNVL